MASVTPILKEFSMSEKEEVTERYFNVNKEWSKEELEAMGWQDVRALAGKLGITYTTKDEAVRDIVTKTNKYVRVIFKKNYLQYKRGNAYSVNTTMRNKFKKMKLIT